MERIYIKQTDIGLRQYIISQVKRHINDGNVLDKESIRIIARNNKITQKRVMKIVDSYNRSEAIKAGRALKKLPKVVESESDVIKRLREELDADTKN